MNELAAANKLLEQKRRDNRRSVSVAAANQWLAPLAAAIESASVRETAPASGDPNVFIVDPSNAASGQCGNAGRTGMRFKLNRELANEMQRRRQTNNARYWLMARHRFNRQQGVEMAAAEAIQRQWIDDFNVSQRQARRIMAAGMDIYWSWTTKGKIRIHSPHNVAGKLGIGRVSNVYLNVELSDLRSAQALADVILAAAITANAGKPMSTASVRDTTGTDRVSQWRTRQRLGIEATANYRRLSDTERADEESTFLFTDKHGRQGRAGRVYLAKRIPNSYEQLADTAINRRRSDHANRHLSNPKSKNGISHGERHRNKAERRYFAEGNAAANAANRSRSEPVYLRAQTTRRGAIFWHTLSD